MVKNNFKAKWQTALRERGDNPEAIAREQSHYVNDSNRIAADLNLSLRQISTVNGEVTQACRDIVECLDECQEVAGLSFGEVHMEIDSKSSKLPIHVSLRRTRDILKITLARFSVLAVHAEEIEAANRIYQDRIKSLEESSLTSTRTLLEASWIGPNPTAEEREDFKDSKQPYNRYGLEYAGIDDDWVTTHIMKGSALKEHRSVTPALTRDSDSDSEIDDHKNRSLTVATNRKAIVTPISPVQRRLKNHSDLA